MGGIDGEAKFCIELCGQCKKNMGQGCWSPVFGIQKGWIICVCCLGWLRCRSMMLHCISSSSRQAHACATQLALLALSQFKPLQGNSHHNHTLLQTCVQAIQLHVYCVLCFLLHSIFLATVLLVLLSPSLVTSQSQPELIPSKVLCCSRLMNIEH